MRSRSHQEPISMSAPKRSWESERRKLAVRRFLTVGLACRVACSWCLRSCPPQSNSDGLIWNEWLRKTPAVKDFSGRSAFATFADYRRIIPSEYLPIQYSVFRSDI